MENIIKMKENTSFKKRLVGVMSGMIAIMGVLFCLWFLFMGLSNRQHQKNMEQLLCLDSFWGTLDNVNRNVYQYALEGDENIYMEISEDCDAGKKYLKTMADRKISAGFYRDIRDLQEMFSSYISCIKKIYDHSYLCEVMTIGSKQVINKYYNETQDVYRAIQSEFQNLYSQILEDTEKKEETLRKWNSFCWLDMICIMIATIFLEIKDVLTIQHRVVRPVEALTDSARQFEVQGKEQELCIVEEEMDEEMQHLIQVYNSMILRIQKQMKKIQENASAMEKLKNQELENLRISNRLKTSELKALQMQINPHFLFNTLNMISQTAYMENAEKTMELLGCTARLLRYTLDHTDKAVTLAKEVEILGNYVELQEQRFGDRIAFEFDLDESFHQIMVPSMILQPLVENCIMHGVGMKGSGSRIRICTRYDRKHKKGYLIISDNGRGMDMEMLTEIRRQMRQTSGMDQKIGLGNVYLRLMIFFNYEASMEIYSNPGKGTRIVMTLPYEKSWFDGGKRCIG